jgi:Holliday junction DNA helicase RuvA
VIASLTGTLATRESDQAVVDVGGVGYLVFASRRTLDGLPGIGEAVRLHVETHVREDHIHLYGFLDEAERRWFRTLMTVQGVGARVALAILSVLTPDELIHAIAAQDKTAVSRAEGVGPKLAGRIVSELKDKAGEATLARVARIGPAATALPGAAGPTADAVSALVNLGYGRSEAFGAIAEAARAAGASASVEALVKAGLKELGA